MNILAISDWIDPLIYSEKLKYRMSDIDLIISCGDISVNYMDFVMSELNKPLLFVVGNHINPKNYTMSIGEKARVNIPSCFKNCHLKMHTINGVIISGFEGSVWYNGGPFQYRQWEVFFKLLALIPRLCINKLIYGKYIDIFVAHSPPFKIGDLPDPCHNGLKAFNWFIKTFKPQFFIHGHVHLLDRNAIREIQYHNTKVINCSGFYKIKIKEPKTDEVV
ncbi:MAG: hypothetical protein A2015_07420 [Spirochaetes bacterium GWF1_31_7]|nr:MAG: hypothetical protein A2Y30_02795 [Spirochaetes bacterium GWE1_32_154]OHD47586.1 MAG: hypothetical protein A2Y29_00240 [Spirochaetes bacterium GWE2_31_10]OHD51247.1 MAG: hypothetical protein A2015_07420 [Spirochaetes bacterium GWF1_31_7]OHD81240.1 MAG: hypothetical protein A2355_03475 [Spirochaetes bacterium RIFOXYB1_FULL_32_8]HBD96143.1 metallophosphoesterase [Spirochaetia bacterium]